MARSKRTGIELTAYDDLFETDESRAEANLSKIREIPVYEIDEIPDHTQVDAEERLSYHVYVYSRDEEMLKIVA